MQDKVKNCSACGKPIIFMKQKGNPNAKGNPIERFPHPDGNLIVDFSTLTYTVVPTKELPKARRLGMKLHLSHFASCPQKEKFRRKK